MATEISEAVLSCGHCKRHQSPEPSNPPSHHNGRIIRIRRMDVWLPGRKGKDRTDSHVHQLEAAVKKTAENIAVVTYLCNLTGFATIAFIHSIDSETMARIAISPFFIILGIPKLILIDEGSENKGAVIKTCDFLKISYNCVSPENHNGILNERFHRCLNKVQRIGAAT